MPPQGSSPIKPAYVPIDLVNKDFYSSEMLDKVNTNTGHGTTRAEQDQNKTELIRCKIKEKKRNNGPDERQQSSP